MTHLELFKLIAQAKFAPASTYARLGFDTTPDSLVAYVNDHTLILEDEAIIVLDADGREIQFDLLHPVIIG